MNDLSRDDWHEIMTTAADYPNIPDEIRRVLAGLAISVREAGGQLEKGLAADDHLVTLMPLSLISAGLKRLDALVDQELA